MKTKLTTPMDKKKKNIKTNKNTKLEAYKQQNKPTFYTGNLFITLLRTAFPFAVKCGLTLWFVPVYFSPFWLINSNLYNIHDHTPHRLILSLQKLQDWHINKKKKKKKNSSKDE